MALAAVAVQWGALMVMPRRWCLSSKEGLRRSLRFRAALAGLVFVGILAGGFWLCAEKMMAEQLQTDEAYQWSTAEGFRERGFPSKVLEAGQPIVYISTSEFVHCLVGITSFLTDSDCAMNRVPAVFWGTLTIFLLYATGRRMFGRDVGLMAAALAAFSPYCLDMSTWGRYPSQLHCTALLTVYCYWRTLENQERIHPRWLWLTAVSFVVMYLTWEASAFVALGMMLAALIQFRGRLRQIVFNRSIWLAMLFVLMSIVLQYSHREIQQAYRMYFGYGDQLITLTPMWRDRSFQILGYLGFTSWSCDPLLPAAGFLGAIIVCASTPISEARTICDRHLRHYLFLDVPIDAHILEALHLPHGSAADTVVCCGTSGGLAMPGGPRCAADAALLVLRTWYGCDVGNRTCHSGQRNHSSTP